MCVFRGEVGGWLNIISISKKYGCEGKKCEYKWRILYYICETGEELRSSPSVSSLFSFSHSLFSLKCCLSARGHFCFVIFLI